MNKRLLYFLILMLFSFLLMFPIQTLEASKYGLLLWFDSLLPSLLPFLILSQLIMKTPLIDSVQKIISPVFQRIFHCSADAAFCIFCGFLCGYPVGARLIALSVKEHRFNILEGQYLLGFCNNVSPAFCISYGILYALARENKFPYLFCIYGASVLFGIFSRPKTCKQIFSSKKKQTSSTENIFQLIDVCIIDSFLIMLKMCGYLMLFSIVTAGIKLFIPVNSLYLLPVLSSVLEITGGLSRLTELPKGILRDSIGIAALSFGGLCCIFQTNSVISDSGLSLKKYIVHKLLITLLALFLFFLWCLFRNLFSINGWC